MRRGRGGNSRQQNRRSPLGHCIHPFRSRVHRMRFPVKTWCSTGTRCRVSGQMCRRMRTWMFHWMVVRLVARTQHPEPPESQQPMQRVSCVPPVSFQLICSRRVASPSRGCEGFSARGVAKVLRPFTRAVTHSHAAWLTWDQQPGCGVGDGVFQSPTC